MKRLLISFFFLGSPILLFAQSVDHNNLDNWEHICFCNTNNSFHPQTIVNADNNWQLLFAMKDGLTLRELDSMKIAYTQSQLLLLRSQRLLERNQKIYKTAFPILNEEQTLALRKQSLSAANSIYPEIEAECKDLIVYLAKQNKSNNAFSILFSYVLDGLIWGKFEKSGIIEERNGTGVWSGNYWFLIPKRPFYCGTNSIDAGNNYTFSYNWSEQSNELMKNFDSTDLENFLKSLERDYRIIDKKIIDEFSAFGFFDKSSNLTIPIIDERSDNNLYLLSNKIIDKLLPVFIKSTDIESLRISYKFKNSSEAVIIFYHEVMWDILNLLLEKQIIQMPIAFKSPETAKPINIADLCLITIKRE